VRALIVAAGDRLVIRRIAPPDTVGGGTVLDPHPRRHGASRELMVRLGRLTRGDADDAGRAATEPERSGARAASAPLIAAAGSRPLTPSALALEERLREAGVEPPLDSQLDPGDLAALRDAGRAVRVSKTLHYHPGVLEDVRRRVIRIAAASGGAVTLAQVRDELGTSRKFAQALLEHLDAERVTIRRGDAHHVRSAAAGAGD
jgi:selenocysteine-specific elongation factor